MQVAGILKNNNLYIRLDGELDECTSLEARSKCDRLIETNLNVRAIIINLAGVRFMDSTGIGFLIGRYKKATRHGIKLYVEKPNLAAAKVLKLSGIYSLISKVDN